MEIPKGFEHNTSQKTHCLRLKKNLYGQKQARQVWNQYLHKGLLQIGFQQSKVDECVYYCGPTIMFCYVDDTILIDPKDKPIDDVIRELQALNYDLTDEGKLETTLKSGLRDLMMADYKWRKLKWSNKFFKI